MVVTPFEYYLLIYSVAYTIVAFGAYQVGKNLLPIVREWLEDKPEPEPGE